MYHMLKGQRKPRVYQGVYFPLDEHQEPGATQEPGKPEPVTEAGATQEQEPEPGTTQESEAPLEPPRDTAEPEPVYTVIGEPVEATEEPGITIVIDPHPALLDNQQDEEASEAELDNWPGPPPRRRLAPLGWSLVGMLVVMLVLPWLETSATVTIVPLTQTVSTTVTAQLVPGSADVARQQIQGRQLATLTMSQSKTVLTTGSGSQPAQAAQGWITLYNALPTLPKPSPQGRCLLGKTAYRSQRTPL